MNLGQYLIFLNQCLCINTTLRHIYSVFQKTEASIKYNILSGTKDNHCQKVMVSLYSTGYIFKSGPENTGQFN